MVEMVYHQRSGDYLFECRDKGHTIEIMLIRVPVQNLDGYPGSLKNDSLNYDIRDKESANASFCTVHLEVFDE